MTKRLTPSVLEHSGWCSASRRRSSPPDSRTSASASQASPWRLASRLTMAPPSAISSCHLNPAVTVGLTVARRSLARRSYIVCGWSEPRRGGVRLLIADGVTGFDVVKNGLATNGYGDRSPGHWLMSGFVCSRHGLHVPEIILAPPTRRTGGLAPSPSAWVHPDHLIAHSDHQHPGEPGAAPAPPCRRRCRLQQLWLFWVAPLIGGALRRHRLPGGRRGQK